MKQKVSKRQILEFISNRRVIEYWELREKFNIADRTAENKLTKLKKEGLVINVPGSRWILTVKGDRRVLYYVERDKRLRL
jgi:Mn-dependent DtxR family transcriptional regulator